MFSKELIGSQDILNKEWGIVFAGGGGKGAYQAGVIKALFECGLAEKITGASGSSIGAINMCLLSQRDGELGINLWNKIKSIDIINVAPELIDGKEGFSSRNGLIKILKENIDFNKIRNDIIDYYATVSEFSSESDNMPVAQYIRLNTLSDEEIISVLLASSALPIIYEPTSANGCMYKDGGITDNTPIRPLYNIGIKNFIVVLLSKKKQIKTEDYPGAEFIVIRPSKELGDLLEGTLNFEKEQIKLREGLGYFDAVRTLKYHNTDISKSPAFNVVWDNSVNDDYNSIKTNLMIEKGERNFNKQMSKIDAIMSKYGI